MKSLWAYDNPYYVPGNPYNWRTWLRSHLPSPMCWLVSKGRDCERVGSQHRWYNTDNENSACYHCAIVRPGQLWKR